MKLHHGGSFTTFPGRSYQNGSETYVDIIDIDKFSVHEIDDVLEILGYSKEQVRYYHYLIPNTDLDFGLRALGSDSDVRHFGTYVSDYKLMNVYVEHQTTNVNTYFFSPAKCRIQELDDEDPDVRDTVVPMKGLFLCWNESTSEVGQSSGH
jgi:hypothetical protein